MESSALETAVHEFASPTNHIFESISHLLFYGVKNNLRHIRDFKLMHMAFSIGGESNIVLYSDFIFL